MPGESKGKGGASLSEQGRASWFRRLFSQRVRFGDPRYPADWYEVSAREVAERYPPVEWGRLLYTDGGGWRLLLLCWLALVDPTDPQGYYHPLVWVEWAPSGEDHRGVREGSYVLLYLAIPFEVGQLRLRFAANWWALRHFGPLQVAWQSWQ